MQNNAITKIKRKKKDVDKVRLTTTTDSARTVAGIMAAARKMKSVTANALMTMFMNNERGLVPIYGSGQFWNTYKVLLLLDSLALHGTLVEWGHTE